MHLSTNDLVFGDCGRSKTRLAAAVAISIPSRPLTSSWSTLQWRYSRPNLNWIRLESLTSQCLKVPMSS
jgi:hypothetical protein